MGSLEARTNALGLNYTSYSFSTQEGVKPTQPNKTPKSPPLPIADTPTAAKLRPDNVKPESGNSSVSENVETPKKIKSAKTYVREVAHLERTPFVFYLSIYFLLGFFIFNTYPEHFKKAYNAGSIAEAACLASPTPTNNISPTNITSEAMNQSGTKNCSISKTKGFLAAITYPIYGFIFCSVLFIVFLFEFILNARSRKRDKKIKSEAVRS